MRFRFPLFLAICWVAFAAAPAQALCAYNGIPYYKTTLQEEYADAPLVVRAKVLSEHSDNPDDPKLKHDWGTFYRIEIEQTFKGNAPQFLTNFTTRDSAGFYLDVGKDYLLFLDPALRGSHLPSGTMEVNYNCGQSREWREVPASDKALMTQMLSNMLCRKRTPGDDPLHGPLSNWAKPAVSAKGHPWTLPAAAAGPEPDKSVPPDCYR